MVIKCLSTEYDFTNEFSTEILTATALVALLNATYIARSNNAFKFIDRVLNNGIPLENSFPLMHVYGMLLPRPNPYEKARRIILFLGAASLVMGVAKLFGVKDNKDDKTQ